MKSSLVYNITKYQLQMRETDITAAIYKARNSSKN